MMQRLRQRPPAARGRASILAIVLGCAGAIGLARDAAADPQAAPPPPSPGPTAAPSAPAPPPPAKPAPPKPQPAPQASVASAVVMDRSGIESIIGRSVKSASGEDLGRLIDFLVTPTGETRAAVIDFGGVLGVGSRKVAVDWRAIDFSNIAKDGTLRLALTRDQVRMAPEYKTGDPVVILQPTRPEEPHPTNTASDKVPPPDHKPPAPASSQQGGGHKP